MSVSGHGSLQAGAVVTQLADFGHSGSGHDRDLKWRVDASWTA